ncbi:sarcosine oxidase subunit delta [Arthrobacter sp. AQ5-05]|uniref:sarcosine oxidase subunit delta n=1 Tax=Arthrobacter sp. AQ5-05 TaxID=2184581 RepID=UPI0012B60F2E|nr:sarcosine oxidase subunit delta [Arthrobacter sp. AQ5-05]
MLLFSCPNCGPRNEGEFHYGGQAHVAYPTHPGDLSDREWAEYLFFRENTKGLFAERWVHSTGCRKWFNMVRDTVSYDIHAVYRMGEQPPTDLDPAATPANAPAQPLAPAQASNTSTSEGV